MSPSTASQQSQQTQQSAKDLPSENKIAANGNQPSAQSNDRSTARPLALRQSLATPAITAPTEISTPKPMCDEIKEIEHVWVPMPDGVRLGARIWLPGTAGSSNRVPAIFEFVPYGKRHGTSYRDEENFVHLSKYGYACVRIDIRGSGESEGILEDEYLPIEQDDAEECIKWIAAQDWCTGAVGMHGLSWGGFNALQLAARNPPNLKGILAHCFSENRFKTDLHYNGGCFLTDNVTWSAFMVTLLAGPPDPALVPHWRSLWQQRLDKLDPWIHTWMEHQRYDAYWQQGSVSTNYDAIKCPVLMASGWSDGYTNAVPAVLAEVKSNPDRLVRGVNGPWSHNYPHLAFPGPQVDWLTESVRWFDYCLKQDPEAKRVWEGRPEYLAYMVEREEPCIIVEHRPGYWVANKSWPSESVKEEQWFLGDKNTLSLDAGDAKDSSVISDFKSPLSTGLDTGRLGYGLDPDYPIEQKLEDAKSLCFDSPVLAESKAILGAVALHLNLSCSQPHGIIAARLCDVDPVTGSSVLVTQAVLNLNHRHDDSNPTPMTPGEMNAVRVVFDDIAHVFPKGNVVRVALSTALWPIVWPPAHNFSLSFAMRTPKCQARLVLPVVTDPKPALESFEKTFTRPPKIGQPADRTELRPASLGTRTLTTDYVTGEKTLVLGKDCGSYRDDTHGMEHDESTKEIYRIKDPLHKNGVPCPLSADVEGLYTIEYGRSKEWIERLKKEGRYVSDETRDWRVRVDTRMRTSSTADHFRVQTEVKVQELDSTGQFQLVANKRWDKLIPRQFV